MVPTRRQWKTAFCRGGRDFYARLIVERLLVLALKSVVERRGSSWGKSRGDAAGYRLDMDYNQYIRRLLPRVGFGGPTYFWNGNVGHPCPLTRIRSCWRSVPSESP